MAHAAGSHKGRPLGRDPHQRPAGAEYLGQHLAVAQTVLQAQGNPRRRQEPGGRRGSRPRLTGLGKDDRQIKRSGERVGIADSRQPVDAAQTVQPLHHQPLGVDGVAMGFAVIYQHHGGDRRQPGSEKRSHGTGADYGNSHDGHDGRETGQQPPPPLGCRPVLRAGRGLNPVKGQRLRSKGFIGGLEFIFT